MARYKRRWKGVGKAILLIVMTTALDAVGSTPLGAFAASALFARADAGCAITAGTTALVDGNAAYIEGSGFGAAQGSGALKLWQNSNRTGYSIAQTIVTWTDTRIDFTAVQDYIATGPGYLFLESDAGCVSNGLAVTIGNLSWTLGTVDDLSVDCCSCPGPPLGPVWDSVTLNWKIWRGDMPEYAVGQTSTVEEDVSSATTVTSCDPDFNVDCDDKSADFYQRIIDGPVTWDDGTVVAAAARAGANTLMLWAGDSLDADLTDDQTIVVQDTTNYDGTHTVSAVDARYIWTNATFVADESSGAWANDAVVSIDSTGHGLSLFEQIEITGTATIDGTYAVIPNGADNFLPVPRPFFRGNETGSWATTDGPPPTKTGSVEALLGGKYGTLTGFAADKADLTLGTGHGLDTGNEIYVPGYGFLTLTWISGDDFWVVANPGDIPLAAYTVSDGRIYCLFYINAHPGWSAAEAVEVQTPP